MKNNTKKLLCLVVLIIVLMIICCLRNNEKFSTDGDKRCPLIPDMVDGNRNPKKAECIGYEDERTRLINERSKIMANPNYSTDSKLQDYVMELDLQIDDLTYEIYNLTHGDTDSYGNQQNIHDGDVPNFPTFSYGEGQFAENVCEVREKEACNVGPECEWVFDFENNKEKCVAQDVPFMDDNNGFGNNGSGNNGSGNNGPGESGIPQ